MSWTIKVSGKKEKDPDRYNTPIYQRSPGDKQQTVSDVVFFPLTKLFQYYTMERLTVVVFFFFSSRYITLILLYWPHSPTMRTIGGKIWFNISKHATVAEWITKQLSLSCYSLSVIVASQHARPVLMSRSTFILITLRMACWHVLKSMASWECDTKHSLHERSIGLSGNL